MAPSKVELVVLGLLAGEPSYGYELLERIEARSMGFWIAVGKASLYQALSRLERQGFVSGTRQEGSEGPDRRVFRISRSGRRRLSTAAVELGGAADPSEMSAGVALGFCDSLPADTARAVIGARETVLRERIAALEGERSARPVGGGAPGPLRDAMLGRQRALAEAELSWLPSLRASLGKVRR